LASGKPVGAGKIEKGNGLFMQGNGAECLFWQTEWQGIQFKELGSHVSPSTLATADFYSEFYRLLFEIYPRYEELPIPWRNVKEETAKAISVEIPHQSSVLSYGCGLGFVERSLSGIRDDVFLDCYDFSEKTSRWLRAAESDHLRFVTVIDAEKKYDVVYACQVLYALPAKQVVDLIRDLSRCLMENGKIIIVHTSLRPCENGASASGYFSGLQVALYKLYSIFRRIFPKPDSQLWGWVRDDAMYGGIFELAGFRVDKAYSSAGQSFMVLSRAGTK